MDIENLDLTEEQKAKILALHEEETAKLKANRDDILGEKKRLAEEKELELESARAAAVKAEEERLKVAGDMEGLKAHYEEQLAKATAEAKESAEKATKALLERDRTSVLKEAQNLIHEDFAVAGEALLSNMLDISYNDQNVAITEFKHNGEVVANNVAEFESWAKEQAAFKSLLKGVRSGGANTQQSTGASGAKMTLTEKAMYLNQNPNATL